MRSPTLAASGSRASPRFPGLACARLDRHEIAGSLGDLGTFLPLLLAMAAQNGLDFAAGLFFAGFFNVVTGLVFAIPMAVQPMKAIAAVAITEGLSVPEIVAAGATVSAFILVLGVTGLIDAVNRLVPRSAVRGIQLAVGLSLVMKGVAMVVGSSESLWAIDGGLAAAGAVLVVLLLSRSRVVPAALVLVAAGVGLALWKHPSALISIAGHAWFPHARWPAVADFDRSVLKAALPQIPLTTLNSVVAVCALSADLFPERAADPRAVSISVGLMNLVGAPFGAMPMCHGAGGLAGQYRFGARTSGSILFLGAAKMAAAVVFGASMMGLCRAFPPSILGVMLGFSGAELALVARDQTGRVDAFVMIATAGVSLAVNNVAVGLLCGLVVALALQWAPGGAGDAA
jgi:hypothetical protein